ncbi:hypothetical protein FRX31_021542 [Thalictrum thalictroides]|uniref:Uncharacterized protein n=1 Tax=Thalictrum thalictroides TaxID=46969 RepID=A0A7J6VVM1_THATH|nr:hypothetical protein FRX31_021542 [Thalictrum thalictroides]
MQLAEEQNRALIEETRVQRHHQLEEQDIDKIKAAQFASKQQQQLLDLMEIGRSYVTYKSSHGN